MMHISGFERSQLLLLPEAVDDCVDADNPVRFIDALVDELDLVAAGFVTVALANKLARIVFAMMKTGESFRTEMFAKA